MPPYGIGLIIVALLALVGLIIVLALVAERRRREAMQQAAGEFGMRYVAGREADEVLSSVRSRFRLFQRGHSRRAKNLLIGRIEDLELLLFDYRYTIGGGKHSRTYRQTVAAMRLPQPALPQFVVRPEHFFDKVGSWVGYDDIDFPQHPTFSSRYMLRGADEQAVRDLFTPDVIERFEQSPRLCAEGGAEWLAVYRAGRRVKPELLTGFVEESFNLCTAMLGA